MPAHETQLGHGISIITLAPEEEFAEVAREMLPIYDRALTEAKANHSLPETELQEIEGWNRRAHQIFNDWSTGTRQTLRGFTGWTDMGLYKLLPESDEKRAILRRLSDAGVNTFGLT
ncbi:MAG TPA: hypothetical protein VL625_07200 [Patescibacteria group bacterium]|nr:hypothetical protein [Patescibacteria group bacterium]